MRYLPILALGLLLGPAGALTLNEVVELSRAGVGDQVIIAAIERDGGEFMLSSSRISQLRREGVSSRVLQALVDSGRRPQRYEDLSLTERRRFSGIQTVPGPYYRPPGAHSLSNPYEERPVFRPNYDPYSGQTVYGPQYDRYDRNDCYDRYDRYDRYPYRPQEIRHNPYGTPPTYCPPGGPPTYVVRPNRPAFVYGPSGTYGRPDCYRPQRYQRDGWQVSARVGPFVVVGSGY